MKINLAIFSILLILLSACANGDREVKTESLIASANSTTNDSYEMHAYGNFNDGVSFSLNGNVIATDIIHDGEYLDGGAGKFNCSWTGTNWECDGTPHNIDFKSSSNDGVTYFSVRYGSKRNEVCLYAAANGKIYRSKSWIYNSTGNVGKGVAVTHANNGITLKGFQFNEGDGANGNPSVSPSVGSIKFNAITLQFEYQNDLNSMISNNSSRGERVLDVQ